MKDNVYEKIINLIREDKLGEAFALVLKELEKTPGKEEVQKVLIGLESSYNALTKELVKELIKYDEFWIKRNKIVDSLLALVQENNTLFPGTHLGEGQSADHYDEILKELGQELAFNYFTVSFGKRFEDIDGHYLKDIFTPTSLEIYENNSHRRRNILLIGSGATASSCPYVPTGEIVKQYLEYKYPALIKEAKLEKKDLDHFPNFDTEKYLSKMYNNLGKGGREQLREALKKIYDVKYLPTHFYEVVAHMLKHSVFDIVINFNIDELFDEAVFEELGKSDYIKVASSVDCKDLDSVFIDGRLKTPVYIKIHGSASDKSSLRFSEGQHFDVPEDIKNFITKWLRGQMDEGGEDHENNRVPANIVCVGFDPERFDFIKFFEDDTLLEGSKWFHINHKTRPLLEKFGLGQYFSGQKNGSRYERWIPTSGWKPIPEKERTNEFIPSLGDIFTRLWSVHIRNAFNEPFRPRNISRHEIVADIFYHAFDHHNSEYFEKNITDIDKKYKELRDYFRNSQYFLERTIVEVAISLCKNKGLLESEQVVNERIGTFYRKYREQSQVEKQKNGIVKPILTLSDIYLVFSLNSDYHYAGDLLNVSKFSEEKDGPFRSKTNLIEDLGYNTRENKGEDIATFFNKPENLHRIILYRLWNCKNLSIVARLKDKFKHNNDLKKHIFERLLVNTSQLRESFTYDIKSRFDDPGALQFQSLDKSHVLHTNLSLSYQFAEEFNHPESWDLMLMIGERGKFLTSHFNVIGSKTRSTPALENKKMIVLACYEALVENFGNLPPKQLNPKYFEELKSSFKKKWNIDLDNIEYTLLPYWQHYHHMVVFLKRRTDTPSKDGVYFNAKGQNTSWEIVKSFYYYKPGFSNQINPVLFPVTSDDSIKLAQMKHDQTWMLKTFFAYFLMSKSFEKSGNSIPIINSESLGLDGDKDDWFGAFLSAINVA